VTKIANKTETIGLVTIGLSLLLCVLPGEVFS